MSKPWSQDGAAGPLHPARARRQWKRIKGDWQETAKGPIPQGGKAGLLLVATACVGVAIVVYQVWGPSDAIVRP